LHRKVNKGKKGLVPIIAVAVMVAVAFLTVGIFSAEINRVFSSPTPEDISVQELALMKHYGYAYFKVVLQSNSDKVLKLDVRVIGEDGATAAQMLGISLSPMSSVEVGASGMFGNKFFVGNSYAVKVTGDLGLSYMVECKGVEFSRNKLILLAIDDFYVDPGQTKIQNSSAIIAGAEETAIRLGIPYEKVTTISRWDSILSSPQKGLIIINPFGSVTPAPSTAVQNGSAAKSFISNLGTLVGDYGWTWVHVGGEAFAQLSNGTVMIKPEGGEGTGIQSFLNSTKVTIPSSNAPMELDEQVLSDTDGNSLMYFLTVTNSTGLLPDKMRFGYPINLASSDLPPTKFVFYEKKNGDSQTAARSVYVGSGYYVHWGGPADLLNEYDTGSLSLMLALYTNLR